MRRLNLLAVTGMFLALAAAPPLGAGSAQAGAARPAMMPQADGYLHRVHRCHDEFDGGRIDGVVVRHKHVGRDCRVIFEDDYYRRGRDHYDRRGRWDYDRYADEHCHDWEGDHWHRGYGRTYHRHSQRSCDVRVLEHYYRGYERPRRGRDCVTIGNLRICD